MRFVMLAALLATPVAAQETFTPPAGCEGVLTIQHRSCLMTNVWQCEGDAEGERWLALFVEPGLYSVRKVNENFEWLETYYLFDRTVETMDPDPIDPASIDVLLAEQTDTYDFTTTSTDGTPPERVVGFDRLTGESTVIDGEPLLRTEFAFDIRLPDGTVERRGAGAQFLSERHRLFILGLAWDGDAPEEVTDMSPVEFIYPGESGFFSAHPKYECGALESSLRVE